MLNPLYKYQESFLIFISLPQPLLRFSFALNRQQGNSNFLTGLSFLNFVLHFFLMPSVWTKIWPCAIHVIKVLHWLPILQDTAKGLPHSTQVRDWTLCIIFHHFWRFHNLKWLVISSMPHTISWFLWSSLSEILPTHTAIQTSCCQNLLVLRFSVGALRCKIFSDLLLEPDSCSHVSLAF